MPGPDVELVQQTRAAAFRLLLETGRPVSPEEIAAEVNAAPSVVVAELGRLAAAGRIRLSAQGYVVGSAGLSVARAAHDLLLGSCRFWTWCAYDVVGIVGTLGADARSLSRSPASGLEIELQFDAGRAPAGPVVLFLPDDVIELDEARRRGLVHWSPLLSAGREIESREGYGDNG